MEVGPNAKIRLCMLWNQRMCYDLFTNADLFLPEADSKEHGREVPALLSFLASPSLSHSCLNQAHSSFSSVFLGSVALTFRFLVSFIPCRTSSSCQWARSLLCSKRQSSPGLTPETFPPAAPERPDGQQ